MKNKKLFAILTLVCFMMTLMPVAAFAAATERDAADADTATVVVDETGVTITLTDHKLTTVADGTFVVTDVPASKITVVDTTTKYALVPTAAVTGTDIVSEATRGEVFTLTQGTVNEFKTHEAHDAYVTAGLDDVAKAAAFIVAYDVCAVDTFANDYTIAKAVVEGDLKSQINTTTFNDLAALKVGDNIAANVAAKGDSNPYKYEYVSSTFANTLVNATGIVIAVNPVDTAAKVTVKASYMVGGKAAVSVTGEVAASIKGVPANVEEALSGNKKIDNTTTLVINVPGIAVGDPVYVTGYTTTTPVSAVAGNGQITLNIAASPATPEAGKVTLSVNGKEYTVDVVITDSANNVPTPAPTPVEGSADRATTAVYTVKNNPTVKIGDDVKLAYELRDAADKYAAAEVLYIWFTEAGSTLPSTGVEAVDGLQPATLANAGVTSIAGLFETETAKYADNALKVEFARAGEYTLHAATLADFNIADDAANTTAAEVMADLNEVKTVSTNKVVTVKGANVDSNDYVVVSPEVGTAADGKTFTTTLGVAADGLAKAGIELTFYEDADLARVVKGETVKIETSSSNIEVSKEEATTNALGKVSFAVSGVREGNYEIYVTCGSYEATIKVAVGATAPTNIVVAKAPTAPVNIDNTADLSDIVRFVITDINGNTLTSDQAKTAGEKAFTLADDGIYASIVSAPAGSDLTDEDVVLVKDTANSNLALGLYSTLAITGGLDVEGTYEFKVALNNGNSVRVTVEAKEFGTPVGIVLEYSAPSVELGGVLNTKDFLLVDKNGVTTQAAGKVALAASGYAIDNFNTTNGTITVKADEKYLGSTINVTAVSERYDLMTSASVKVVAEAAGLMFTAKTAEVNVNNAIQVVLVDAQGNRTAFGDARADRTSYDINYVVLDKPEGAKVAVNTAAADNNLLAAGSFKMNLTCDKVGTVKVQAVAKITKVAADGKDVVKYYTGIGEFAVGTGETGKSVVMSIGSTEMIADGKVGTIDAKPMIQNGRTFVPFRALAEAFGATVAYDQEKAAVTATLNGVEVVMTIGDPGYTVNGVKNTADVAPFVADSRTYVPVRFAAEAFGITVTPTYNADGSVADVLFNM